MVVHPEIPVTMLQVTGVDVDRAGQGVKIVTAGHMQAHHHKVIYIRSYNSYHTITTLPLVVYFVIFLVIDHTPHSISQRSFRAADSRPRDWYLIQAYFFVEAGYGLKR